MPKKSSPTTRKPAARTARKDSKLATKSHPTTTTPPTELPARDTTTSKYIALIYFHGMGEQRRYEEVSRLIDAVDQYGHRHSIPEQASSRRVPRRLININLRWEQPTAGMERPVGYVQAFYLPEANATAQEYRFYEAYYANLVAGGIRPLDVLLWAVKLSSMPFRMRFTHWRELDRLRRATLLADWEKLKSKRAELTEQDYEDLMEAYDRFERWDARRQFRNGTFSDFKSFLTTDLDTKVERGENVNWDAIQWLADQWQRLFRNAMRANTFFAVMLWITLILIIDGVSALIINTVNGNLSHFLISKVTSLLGMQMPSSDFRGALGILVFIGLFAMVQLAGWFLGKYVGDIYFWTSYQETAEKHQKRRAIIDNSVNLLSHVLDSEACERVVLVGHSLGTTIAHDTLLELARLDAVRNPGNAERDESPLRKIHYLVTLGSPIDKIHYFFETATSQYHRYNRITQQIRGDMGTFPFSERDPGKQRRRHRIHWVNIWDKADLASGTLETPTNVKGHVMRVDNYEVAYNGFPDPGSAHTKYLDNDDVLQILDRILFKNDFNFTTRARNAPAIGPQELFGPRGHSSWLTRLFHWSILLILVGLFLWRLSAYINFLLYLVRL